MPNAKTSASASSPLDKEPVTRLIRTTRQATRRRYLPDEKIRIVMEGIRGDEPVSALCRREGISANIYYKWLKDFMEPARAA